PHPREGAGEPRDPAPPRRAGRGLGSRDAARARVEEDGYVASSRVTAPALRFAPTALLIVLEAWVAWDLLSIADRRCAAGLSVLFAGNLAAMALARMARRRWPRWIGLAALGSTYVVAHSFALALPLTAALLLSCGRVAVVLMAALLRTLERRDGGKA